jgi:hypothetical protein
LLMEVRENAENYVRENDWDFELHEELQRELQREKANGWRPPVDDDDDDDLPF